MPLAWRVRHSPKGHCPEALHIEVVELISQLIPEGAKVVFLGDGEFDGTELQRTLHEMGWSSVCRTAMSTTATWNGQTFRLDTLGACLKPGRLIPRYLVSTMATAEEACRLYQKRFYIETFFSDQKSRGFHSHKSHISDVQRLSRLFIAACLAYIWIVY